LSLQFSVRISALQDQIKELTQRLALLEVNEPTSPAKGDRNGSRLKNP
jgi:hypothetical protein